MVYILCVVFAIGICFMGWKILQKNKDKNQKPNEETKNEKK